MSTKIEFDTLPFGRQYVLYSDDIEVVEAEEQQAIDKIIEAMINGEKHTREKYGKSVRTSHAKAHGLLKGELRVLDGLPAYLRQGLFSTPKRYDVIARLSQVPGDLNDDQKVSSPRGFSLKVLGVEGLKLAAHGGELTQDFVLDTGKVFNALGVKTFLAQIALVENVAPQLPELIKGAVSSVSRTTNEALNAIGANSSALDFFGHPFLHPLGESYYSQVPMRYGDYIAKLSITPVTPGLQALKDSKFEPADHDGLRTAVQEFFRLHDAEFEIGIQLCTDLERMPVENANAEWPEDVSPYQSVGRLVFPVQDAYSQARQAFVEDCLSFCPAHSLAAHRPLGSIMRARVQAYEALGKLRFEHNGRTRKEPADIGEMPE